MVMVNISGLMGLLIQGSLGRIGCMELERLCGKMGGLMVGSGWRIRCRGWEFLSVIRLFIEGSFIATKSADLALSKGTVATGKMIRKKALVSKTTSMAYGNRANKSCNLTSKNLPSSKLVSFIFTVTKISSTKRDSNPFQRILMQKWLDCFAA